MTKVYCIYEVLKASVVTVTLEWKGKQGNGPTCSVSPSGTLALKCVALNY